MTDDEILDIAADAQEAIISGQMFAATQAADLLRFARLILSAQAESYTAANPLGGPATMFEAIASRLRAGEDCQAVMEDYGVVIDEPPLAARIESVCATLHVGLNVQAQDLVEITRRVRSVIGGG